MRQCWIPFPKAHFDVVTSSRCLMALLDWEKQKQALVEVHRVLKPGGVLVCMEGTFDGLEKLNQARAKFGLEAIDASGRERLYTLKFWERELLDFVKPYYVHERTQRFGMYYFLTRIVQPLLMAPDAQGMTTSSMTSPSVLPRIIRILKIWAHWWHSFFPNVDEA